ncbi:hypothetical protein Q8791_12525 [Nocardiopsis sp. CT-R113]|uniref:DUF4380 domain-containing protein n=1 Tax=Nocardiopsis codii TaxID=3065942 RepID=A0ABU7K713_9ACTN|nr:hypothetical protein [Nocardiopsis sp. CT-R113]MEE2038041.1 hypothetical protein [Nocardiopsis sp. CT-R113]
MTGAVTVERDTSGAHELVVLDNGVLRVTAAPALGGRILSVRHLGREHLYRNPRLLGEDLQPVAGVVLGPVGGPMSAWHNVGGDKTWPAPQGWDGPDQWAGPPDPVLDSGAYAAETATAADGSATLTMNSADDQRSGLRLVRRLTLEPGASGYRLDLEAVNTSGVPREWALWNVTQIEGGHGTGRPAAGRGTGPGGESGGDGRGADTGGHGVYVGVSGTGPHTVPLVAGDANPATVEHTPSVVRVPAQDVVGKVGFPTASGWLANVGAAGTLTQRFAVDGGAAYPDGGSRVQVWLEYPVEHPLEHLGGLCPVDRVVECEALGPLTVLDPGGSTALTVEFGFGTTTGPVVDVTPEGYWAQPSGTGPAEGGNPQPSAVFTALREGTPDGGAPPRQDAGPGSGPGAPVSADRTRTHDHHPDQE